MHTDRGLIFDMDGVLFLSSHAHEQAFLRIFQTLGVSGFEYARYAGMRTDDVFEQFLRQNGYAMSSQELSSLVTQKRNLAHDLLRKTAPLTHRCKETLDHLSRRFRLALATSASLENVSLFLNQSQTQGIFQVVLSGADVKKAKPDPEIYLTALSALKLPAAHGVVVEDSTNGIRAGVAAGMRVIGVTGLHTPEQLKASGAYLVIDQVSELLQFMEDI